MALQKRISYRMALISALGLEFVVTVGPMQVIKYQGQELVHGLQPFN